MLQIKLRRKLALTLTTVAITASLANPSTASFLPTNGIDFGNIGGSQTPFGNLGGIMGDLGINLPDISNILGDSWVDARRDARRSAAQNTLGKA